MSVDAVYETDRCIVWKGDCADVLAGLPTESLDLVVTDPPYGQEWQSSMRRESFSPILGDGVADRGAIHQALVECVRLVGQRRHLYVFGPSDVLEGLKVSKSTELVWDKAKMGMGDLSSPWGPQHEPITFAVSLHRHAGKVGNDALPVRLRKGSVLRFTPPTGRNVRHPTEKPVGLLRELIESSSRSGETVLDPYAGSGSTGVAALLSGRKAVLVERDEQYLPLVLDRIQQAEKIVDQQEAA